MNLRGDNEYLRKLISEGEYENQDFKFEISDARKIAKSLSAFSNTSGGRLLIGVKDNGNIAGIRSEEEMYMVDSAAKLYSFPPISYDIINYTIDKKTVLEIVIHEGKDKPYFAIDKENKKWAYLRIKDKNILASKVHLKIWEQTNMPKGSFVKYSKKEQLLFDYLSKNNEISISKFSRIAKIPSNRAENILAKFIRFNLIEFHFDGEKFMYRIKE